MPFRWLVLLLSLTLLSATCASNSAGKLDTKPVPDFVFQRFQFTSPCNLKPGQFHVVQLPPDQPRGIIPTQRTHFDQLTLPLSEVPALAVTAEAAQTVMITGTPRDTWSLRLCAESRELEEDNAKSKLNQFSMKRMGNTIALSIPENFNPGSSSASLDVAAPANAPVIVQGTSAAVEIRDMTGPVRIGVGGATILDTTGSVDAVAELLTFAASKGTVTLAAGTQMNLKFTSETFNGSIHALAHGPLRMLVPHGFQTPFVVVLDQPKEFYCRAAICSKIVAAKNSFTYPGDGRTPPRKLFFRSRQAVLIDNSN